MAAAPVAPRPPWRWRITQDLGTGASAVGMGNTDAPARVLPYRFRLFCPGAEVPAYRGRCDHPDDLAHDRDARRSLSDFCTHARAHRVELEITRARLLHVEVAQLLI
jgi:hypothetical protein